MRNYLKNCDNHEREERGKEVANASLHCKQMFRHLYSRLQLHPHLRTASHMTTQRDRGIQVT